MFSRETRRLANEQCAHPRTIQSEEGHECLMCGKVLGHSYRASEPCTHPTSTGPTPGMQEDGDHRRICTVCHRRFQPEPEPNAPDLIPWPPEDDPTEAFIEFPETFSWDVYQPVV